LPTPRNNFGAHVENIHVHSRQWFLRKKEKNNISNKKLIRRLIWFNDDNDHPFKLFKWFNTNFFWKNAIPYWFPPWFFIVQWRTLSALNMKIPPFLVSNFTSNSGKQNIARPFAPIIFSAFCDLNISDYHWM